MATVPNMVTASAMDMKLEEKRNKIRIIKKNKFKIIHINHFEYINHE